MRIEIIMTAKLFNRLPYGISDTTQTENDAYDDKTHFIEAPHSINAAIVLPSSKSISNRALILNALCPNPKPIHNFSVCDDTDVVIKALNGKQEIIDVGAAGTAMRFLTAYFAGQQGHHIITGTKRMKNRPVKLLVEALRTVGAQIDYLEKDGFPPLRIEGQTLNGGEIELDGSVSSQFVSALLMMAPVMTNGLRLHLTGRIISASYIYITSQLMRQFGVTVFEVNQTFSIPHQSYASPDNFTVESDWSAASYWYEIVALCPNEKATVSLQGLRADSLQGDAAIVQLFDKLGVNTSFTSSGAILTKKPRTLNGPLNYDFILIPDMAQTVAVTCVMLQIPFRFTGLQSLKIKETDRLAALRTELSKLGYLLEIHDDNTLEWKGEHYRQDTLSATDQKIHIATYEDHRMAMAFAPVALCMKNGIHIANPEVVSKSYPSFWNDLKKANFKVRPVVDANCCALYEMCELNGLPATLKEKIDYFDDEELDQYRGITSDKHSVKAIEEFCEVLYTMQAKEVRDWLHSLQLRDIHLPDQLKDEVLLIINN